MLVEVTYGITEELQKKLLVETGERKGETRTEPVDLDSKELRQAWVTLFGLKNKANITHRSYLDVIKVKYDLETFRFELPPAYVELLTNDEIKTAILAEAITFEQELAEAKQESAEDEAKYQANLKLAKPIIRIIKEAEKAEDLKVLQTLVIPPEIKDFKARSALHEVEALCFDAISDVYDIQAQAEREVQQAQREAEKAIWIEAHGSDQLKRAFADQYEVGRIYTLERASNEYPEWEIDYFGFSEWKDRKNPPLSELDAADETAAQTGQPVNIVWLTQPAAIDREEFDEAVYYFKQHPALVIHGYLGKYDLVKSL